jgi:hypothetical protein
MNPGDIGGLIMAGFFLVPIVGGVLMSLSMRDHPERLEPEDLR